MLTCCRWAANQIREAYCVSHEDDGVKSVGAFSELVDQCWCPPHSVFLLDGFYQCSSRVYQLLIVEEAPFYGWESACCLTVVKGVD